jgi:hypothetical protein
MGGNKLKCKAFSALVFGNQAAGAGGFMLIP